MYIQKLLIERLMVGQEAQSESIKAFNWSKESKGKNNPWASAPLIDQIMQASEQQLQNDEL